MFPQRCGIFSRHCILRTFVGSECNRSSVRRRLQQSKKHPKSRGLGVEQDRSHIQLRGKNQENQHSNLILTLLTPATALHWPNQLETRGLESMLICPMQVSHSGQRALQRWMWKESSNTFVFNFDVMILVHHIAGPYCVEVLFEKYFLKIRSCLTTTSSAYKTRRENSTFASFTALHVLNRVSQQSLAFVFCGSFSLDFGKARRQMKLGSSSWEGVPGRGWRI